MRKEGYYWVCYAGAWIIAFWEGCFFIDRLFPDGLKENDKSISEIDEKTIVRNESPDMSESKLSYINNLVPEYDKFFGKEPREFKEFCEQNPVLNEIFFKHFRINE